MGVRPAFDVPHSRHGSGTTWLPDSSPVHAVRRTSGQWTVSLHGVVYGQYVDQSTRRGDRQVGVTDWEMVMAMRPLGGGLLRLQAMTSIEPFVLGGSGYPLLLQNGGTYRHSPIHDRQHSHEALMELAAIYERRVARGVAASVYVGAAGEPALGPVAFLHRPSSQDDPLAPLGHHWQDAAHESFGVVTLGRSTRKVKLEGSAFNSREADENHFVVDYRGARLDSYAGRISWAATARVVAAAWWGYLHEPERIDPTTRLHRAGASVLTDARGPGASPHHPSSSLLAETHLDVGRRRCNATPAVGTRGGTLARRARGSELRPAGSAGDVRHAESDRLRGLRSASPEARRGGTVTA